MQLTGFTDEAGTAIQTQIKATQELGWKALSLRGVDGTNIHDLSEADFNTTAEAIQQAGLNVAEFGTLIGTWAKSIHTDFNLTLEEIDRCIPRMHALDVDIVRVMSYAQEPWGDEQYEEERFRRLREIQQRFADANITVAHENCMNWGGFSAQHTLRLLEQVPGIKLLFDTGNPVFQRDRSQPDADGNYPWQDALAFYHAVKPFMVHVHIKDCLNPIKDGVEPEYTFPGEGQAYVKEILADLKASDYKGYIAIEPHVATVFHAPADQVDWQQCYSSYINYGRALESLIKQA